MKNEIKKLLSLLQETKEIPHPCILYIDKILSIFEHVVSNYDRIHIYTEIMNDKSYHKLLQTSTVKKLVELENQIDDFIFTLQIKSMAFKKIKKKYFEKRKNIKETEILLSYKTKSLDTAKYILEFV